MDQNKVSIIIPCFNDADHIQQAVLSALDQTYVNREIIVVDDGSNAQTKAVLKTLEPTISLLITQENKGTSAARNTGIAVASGEYILVLDSDDYFEPTFCERSIEIFHQKDYIKVVTCFARWFWNEKDYQVFKPCGGNLINYLIHNAAIGTSMFRKKDWEEIEGYDENMAGYEDWEFFIRLHKNGGETYVIPEVLFHYRKKQNSRNKKANLAKYELLEYIFTKHADIYKEHFDFFIHEWLKSIRKSEAFKQQVMNSLDYKIGRKLLKPLRLMGFFKKKNNS